MHGPIRRSKHWQEAADGSRTATEAQANNGCVGGGGGGVWHKASVSDCLPLAAPMGLSPLLILTLWGPERVLVVSTEPPDDLSCLTTPSRPSRRADPVAVGVGGGGGGSGNKKSAPNWPEEKFFCAMKRGGNMEANGTLWGLGCMPHFCNKNPNQLPPRWDIPSLPLLYGALDGHPFFPSHVASGRCVLTAAAACAPAGVVAAFAAPGLCQRCTVSGAPRMWRWWRVPKPKLFTPMEGLQHAAHAMFDRFGRVAVSNKIGLGVWAVAGDELPGACRPSPKQPFPKGQWAPMQGPHWHHMAPWVSIRLATSVCQPRHDRMGQGPTEPHAGRSTFLLSSGGAGGGYY